MKKRNKMFALSLTLSSLLFVGYAADQQTNPALTSTETVKAATIAENKLTSASTQKAAPVYKTENEAITPKIEEKTDIQPDSKKETKKETKEDSKKNSSQETHPHLIDEIKSKDLALTHAALTDSGTTFVKVNLDHDNGRQIYEVEFFDSNYTEYEFEIDGHSGKILSWEIDD